MEELSARAQQEGALGLGTERYLNSAKANAVLPDGAEWYTVRVKFSRYSHQRAHSRKLLRVVSSIGDIDWLQQNMTPDIDADSVVAE